MAKTERNAEREARIYNDIMVDCYHDDERAMGGYYYLQDQLQLPFSATCTIKRAISPLRVKDKVEVIDMAPEDDCAHEIFVTIRWDKEGLAVPLAQLQPLGRTDEQTQQAVADWHYWVEMGYEF